MYKRKKIRQKVWFTPTKLYESDFAQYEQQKISFLGVYIRFFDFDMVLAVVHEKCLSEALFGA